MNNYMIGLMKIFKQAKNLLVGTTEFYFYINGKIQDGGSEGGSVSSGAFGFIFPIAPASVGICKAIGDFYNIEIYPKYIMIMVIFILVCIYRSIGVTTKEIKYSENMITKKSTNGIIYCHFFL